MYDKMSLPNKDMEDKNMVIDFGNKKSFNTLAEVDAFLNDNKLTKYRVYECTYPEMKFYIIEWEE